MATTEPDVQSDEPGEILAAEVPQAEPETPADPLAVTDTVLQAHLIRQKNHERDLAPSLAKAAREDAEREQRLAEMNAVDAAWQAHLRKEREAQQARDDAATAQARADALCEQIASQQAAISAAKEELARINKTLKG